MSAARSIALVVLLVAGCEVGPPAVEEPVAVIGCGQPVGGPFALPADTAVEAGGDYDQELAALDLTALPETLDLTGVATFHRALVAYMLEVAPADLPLQLQRDALLERPLGRAVLAAFAAGRTEHPMWPDLDWLRRGLHRYYACSRAMPATLADFERSFAPIGEGLSRQLHSKVKNEVRVLRENPAEGVFVAQTLIDGVVRETEIVLQGRRPDGALDFVVYDADGHLSDRSRFVTADGVDISGAAPYVCLTCHMSPPTFTADVVYPLSI